MVDFLTAVLNRENVRGWERFKGAVSMLGWDLDEKVRSIRALHDEGHISPMGALMMTIDAKCYYATRVTGRLCYLRREPA